MARKINNLKFKHQVNIPVSEVYDAFVHASAYCEWLCSAAQVDAVRGGRVYLWWESGYHTNGEFIELLQNAEEGEFLTAIPENAEDRERIEI